MSRSSGVRVSSNRVQSSSVKPSLPPTSMLRGSRGRPVFSASNIPSTIANEELTVLGVRYLILASVTLRKPFGSERACSCVENETCLYAGALEGGLRLPFPAVVREVLSFLGLAHGQIVPNSWRLLIGCAALWGAMSDGLTPLSKGPFLNQFSVKEAPGGVVWYYFTKRPGEEDLVTELHNVNKNWKFTHT